MLQLYLLQSVRDIYFASFTVLGYFFGSQYNKTE